MAKFKLVFEDKVVLDGRKPNADEMIVSVVAFKDLQEYTKSLGHIIPVEYIPTPVGKIPVYFRIIRKNDEDNYYKEYNSDIRYWASLHFQQDPEYVKMKEAGFAPVYIDYPVGYNIDGIPKYFDVEDPSQNTDSRLNAQDMLETLIEAISGNSNFEKILKMKQDGYKESEIVKSLDCCLTTAYKEVERFKLLAAALWGIPYDGKKK